jgi:hypothetical protein
MLAFVGDAHDGRLGLGRGCCESVPVPGLCGAAPSGAAPPDRGGLGVMRLRFGADSSIVKARLYESEIQHFSER